MLIRAPRARSVWACQELHAIVAAILHAARGCQPVLRGTCSFSAREVLNIGQSISCPVFFRLPRSTISSVLPQVAKRKSIPCPGDYHIRMRPLGLNRPLKANRAQELPCFLHVFPGVLTHVSVAKYRCRKTSYLHRRAIVLSSTSYYY